MGLLLRQIGALVRKDLLILFNRRGARISTIWRAWVIPVVFALYMGILLKVYWPKEEYGIGEPSQVLSLPDAMRAAKGGRNTLTLVNSVSPRGDIDRVIELISREVPEGKIIRNFDNHFDLIETCRSSLQGTTKCFGAVVFNSSPKEGTGGIWNYTLRGDASFGTNVDVRKTTNDPQIYQLPLQRAVDTAIAKVNSSGDAVILPSNVDGYPFTSITQKQWLDKISIDINKAMVNVLSVVWYIGFVGVMYQLVGVIARERETGMSDLVETMMPNVRRWEPQFARVVAHHLGFSATYAPSWIVMAVFLKVGLFPKTSAGVLIVQFILSGLSITSFSILGGSFFRKAQLSGISTVVVALVLGIIAQITMKWMSSGTVAVLALLFQPMTFVFALSTISRWESQAVPANLLKTASGSHWVLAPIILWVYMIIQTFSYPLIAMLVERILYSTAAHRSRRHVAQEGNEDIAPVQLTNFRKVYEKPVFLRFVAKIFKREVKEVVAIDDLSVSALKGQILVLVGANGCGKTTILNAISGLGGITNGSISLDGAGGFGLCPQKNVLWNGLSVEQHANIFHILKTVTKTNVKEDVDKLIAQCGLEDKRKAIAKTLSGGQKRKLQLICMLIGGSRVCCVDEVSGGLDPVSRRRVWDILLAERGSRTFLLTTHFLDEAEYLADQMIIIFKGRLKAEGSTSELKARLGNGYRFTVPPGTDDTPDQDGPTAVSSKLHAEETFSTTNTATAMKKIKSFQTRGIKNYQIAGPTIEEVFMKLAVDESHDNVDPEDLSHDESSPSPQYPSHVHEKNSALVQVKSNSTAMLLAGYRTGTIRQAFILFRKRIKILRWTWVAYFSVVAIPIIAAGMVSILLNDFKNPGCDFIDQISLSDRFNLSDDLQPHLVVGPASSFTEQKISLFLGALSDLSSSKDGPNATSLVDSVHLVNSLDEFNDFVKTNYSTIVPGGFYVGSEGSNPTFGYRSNIGTLGVYSAIFIQNAMDIFLTNQSIVTQFSVFDIPWPPKTEYSLQFVFYFGLVMATYPAFFALYPTIERLRGVRALQYSNGVRSLPLWLAYLIFDGVIVLFISAVITIILVARVPDAWYNIGNLFVCLFFYSIASIQLSYVISLFSKSQLSAFAFSAGGQAFMLLMYLSAYMSINSRSPPDQIQSQILVVHFVLGLITPIGQLLRAVIIGLNLFSVLCIGAPPVKSTNYSGIKFYGGPIVYLIGQSLVLFGFLIWHDHGFSLNKFRNSQLPIDTEDTTTHEKEVSDEIARASNSDDGLRILHTRKTFSSVLSGKVRAVDDLTFGVKRGEVFALVGPNGAGKSTTISMLRGEIRPDRGHGEMYIENISVSKDRDVARSHLGVCPQHDALDQMTVVEHLRFYAGVRGVKNVNQNVQALIRAVGLAPFSGTMGNKLSGGNKRKLSLAIALIGNPEVLLLDEPSSSMDPLAKRSMWKTLSCFVPQRSILLTTHSMEEADALADRVGVVAKHMLDVGTTNHLRQKYGYGFHIHLILKSAPHSTDEEMQNVEDWVKTKWLGAEIERNAYHGQLRFNIPSSANQPRPQTNISTDGIIAIPPTTSSPIISTAQTEDTSVGSLFVLLEENKASLGLEFYSVSLSTFDEIFLKVVSKHGVEEEEVRQMDRGLKAIKESLAKLPPAQRRSIKTLLFIVTGGLSYFFI